MMVVLFHMQVQLERLGYTGYWPSWLFKGVDIFFVISGFIMWVTTVERPIGPATFYWRRFTRIVPLYWILTSVLVVTMLWSPALVRTGQFNLYHVVASYIFIPATHPVLGGLRPVLIAGWTLNYEMFFYAAFGAALLLPAHRRLVAILAFLSATVLLGTLLPSDTVLRFYGSSIILEFGFGVGLGAAFMNGLFLPVTLAWLSVALGALALTGVHSTEMPLALTAGFPALAVVAGALSLEHARRVRKMRSLRLVGDSSYSLYLSHGIVLSACGQAAHKLEVLGRLGTPTAFFLVAFVIFGCAATTGAAIFMFRFVEKPLIRLFQARRRPVVDVAASA